MKDSAQSSNSHRSCAVARAAMLGTGAAGGAGDDRDAVLGPKSTRAPNTALTHIATVLDEMALRIRSMSGARVSGSRSIAIGTKPWCSTICTFR